jgi:hypothetical protein
LVIFAILMEASPDPLAIIAAFWLELATQTTGSLWKVGPPNVKLAAVLGSQTRTVVSSLPVIICFPNNNQI